MDEAQAIVLQRETDLTDLSDHQLTHGLVATMNELNAIATTSGKSA